MGRISRLTVAMHEAGHAAMLLTTPDAPVIASISVFTPGSDTLGHVDAIARWRPGLMERYDVSAATKSEWRSFAREDVIFYLAGPIAELRWTRHPRAQIWFAAREFAERCLGPVAPPFGTDFENVRRRLLWLDPGRASDLFIELWLEVEDRVARHMANITRLGRVLHARSHVDGEDLEALWSSWAS